MAELIVGALIGAVVVWLVMRRRAGRQIETPRADLARAWQEGYDAGSRAVAAQAPATSPAPAPSRAPEPAPAAAAAPVRTPLPFLTPSGPTDEERVERKAIRDRRNINITLYTASLLLVAAASLFVGAALPPAARALTLPVIALAFYAAGLIIHAVSSILRPAAVAFTGTGLALVPVVGLALNALLLEDPVLWWLVTSAAGTVMLVVAAVRLDSVVLGYLALPLVLSTVMAGGATIQQGMVWALILWIGLATLLGWLTLEDDRGRFLPHSLRPALERLHRWITPGAVAVSLLLGVWVDQVRMLLLVLAATAYYVTQAVTGPESLRLIHSYAARAGLMWTVLQVAVVAQWPWPALIGVLVVMLCLQAVATYAVEAAGGHLPTGQPALVDRLVCLGVALMLTAAVQAAEGSAWPGLALTVLVLTAAGVTVTETLRAPRGAPGAGARVGWQAVMPVALTPLVATGLPVELYWAGVVLSELALAVLVRRTSAGNGSDRAPWDARLAVHLDVLAGLPLVYLILGDWYALLGTALVALVWAAVTQAVSLGLVRGRDDVGLGAWTAGSVLATGLVWLDGADGVPDTLQTVGLYTVLLVIPALALVWLRGSAPRGVVLGVGIAALLVAGIRLEVALGHWHSVTVTAVWTLWLLALALLGRDALTRPVRAGLLLAVQGGSAVTVARAMDLIGADHSAVLGTSAVVLLAGLALRRWLASRLQHLGSGPVSTAVVATALVILWGTEVVLGADRATLQVITLTLAGTGLLLGRAHHGHWVVLLTGIVVLVQLSTAADPLIAHGDPGAPDGGWLPRALMPASAAAGLLLTAALVPLAREATASVRAVSLRADRFRLGSLALLWGVGALLALGLTPVSEGVLGVAALIAALVGSVLATTRGQPALLGLTVAGVPAGLALLLGWGQDRGLWPDPGPWTLLGVATASGALLLGWSRLQGAPGTAILHRSGLAIPLAAGLVEPLRRPLHAGYPDDAIVLTAVGLVLAGTWLLVETGIPRAWRLTGRDVAAMVTLGAGLRVWWQLIEPAEVGRALWWSVQATVVAVGLWGLLVHGRHESAERRLRRRLFLVAAAGLFTVSAVYVLVGGTALMQGTVLAGFAVLVVLGLTLREAAFTWWGAAGVGLSVLWYLRQYTYLYLAVLGAVLIWLAVRQLRRQGQDRR